MICASTGASRKIVQNLTQPIYSKNDNKKKIERYSIEFKGNIFQQILIHLISVGIAHVSRIRFLVKREHRNLPRLEQFSARPTKHTDAAVAAAATLSATLLLGRPPPAPTRCSLIIMTRNRGDSLPFS